MEEAPMTVPASSTASPSDLAARLEDQSDLDPLLDRIGDARIVCIGEASHGTHEFYAWRDLLTRRLIEESGFDFVGVEGDWPDCYAVHRSIVAATEAPEDPREALSRFERWPTWMWANEEVVAFTRWLRAVNTTRPRERRVGFYGLDVYSLWESLRAVLDYLSERYPEHLDAALEACRCFEPYAEDPQAYAQATRFVPTDCEMEVIALLTDLLQRHAHEGDSGDPEDREARFAAEQNARAVVGAEAYYRAMVRGGAESWNVRDTHMADTIDALLAHHADSRGNEQVKGVVWEHNTHVGDARFTDMRDAGMVNVGQLMRERHGESDVVLVGFGSHHGSVVAGRSWGAPAERMGVPAARQGSIEALMHDSLTAESALFVFPDALPTWATDDRSHRAIGVVYRPEAERWGNYVTTILGRRYDAFLWLDETTALAPLGVDGEPGELETWPFGA
jgi:erythromycin esterase